MRSNLTRCIATIVVGVVAFCVPSLATAEVGDANSDPNNGTYSVRAVGYESSSSGGSGGSGPTCTWTDMSDGAGIDGGSNGSVRYDGTRDGPNGVEMLWLKSGCSDGSIAEFVYVPSIDPAELRQRLIAEVTGQIPLPVLNVSPPADVGGFIRIQNWLAVEPATSPSGSASVGPVWVDAVATQEGLAWDMGNGDAGVQCDGIGSPLASAEVNLVEISGDAECGYTYEHVSAPQFTGTNDLAYHNTVTSEWVVAWNDSTGANGTIDFDRELPWTFQVRQIQTQRTSGG